MEIYILVSLVVVFVSGWVLYTQGKAWSLEIMSNQELGETVNKILLVLFYLFNSGLILISIIVWSTEQYEVIYVIERVGIALACIGALHIINVLGFLIMFYFKLFQK